MPTNKPRALVVDDDPGVQDVVASILTEGGFVCTCADNGADAYAALQRDSFDLLLIDRKLPDTDGVRLLRQLRGEGIWTPAIVITGHPSLSTAVGALQAVAFDYLTKPFDAQVLLDKARRAIAAGSLVSDNLYLWETLREKYGWQHVMSRNIQVQQAYVMAAKAALSPAPVLIEGGTGTGKEYLARAIHYMSERADGSFVALNCGGFPDELLENELFGHDKGAFTSAHAAKAGLCDIAHGGTLFLDEICHMTPAMQTKLLRFAEDHTFTPLGSTKPRSVDVRIIAASNQPVAQMVKSGKFREDLYYRLNVIPLHLLPLRERPEDLEPFVAHFIAQFSPEAHRQIPAAAWGKLKEHAWPGNLRELRNVIQRAVVLAIADTIEEEHLLLEADAPAPTAAPPSPASPLPVVSLSNLPSLAEAEKQHILTVLDACSGDKAAAAGVLGISRSTLTRRLKSYEEPD